MFDRKGAVIFGHVGLVIQNGLFEWYYFSVSGKDNNSAMKIDFAYLGKIYHFTHIKQINNCINRCKNAKNLITKGVYTDMYRFPGNFSPTKRYCSDLYDNKKRHKYNLLRQNCLQVAATALSKGRCTGTYKKQYTSVISYLQRMTIPNNALFAMQHFEKNIRTYYKLNWLQRMVVKEPFYYFYNRPPA